MSMQESGQVGSERADLFKNRSTFRADELRRRRDKQAVELRKQKREESLAKRRNIDLEKQLEIETEDEVSRIPLVGAQLEQELKVMTEDILTEDPMRQFDATSKFRKLLCQNKRPPIRQVLNCGVVQRFVQFLRSDRPKLQFEAAWVLTNIASGDTAETSVVIQHGAVPIFIELLSSPEPDVREQAVWALGNIAGDSADFRNEVLRLGAMGPLLRLLETEQKLTMIRNATWTLSNFCRGRKPAPDWDLVSPALPIIARLLHHGDKDVVQDACWAISYLSDGSEEKINDVIASGVGPRLVELLLAPGPLQTPALRSVGNIVTGNDEQTQYIINCGVLPVLLALLSSNKETVRKETCWTISNITAGNTDQIQAVMDAGLIPPLVELLRTADLKTKKEACWAISNASSGGEYRPDQIKYLVECGCIRPLCNLLQHTEPKMTLVALDCLEHILRVGQREMAQTDNMNIYALDIELAGGMCAIEELQEDEDKDVYSKAYKIIEEYYNADEFDDDGMDHEPQGQNQFAMPENVQAPQGGFTFGQ